MVAIESVPEHYFQVWKWEAGEAKLASSHPSEPEGFHAMLRAGPQAILVANRSQRSKHSKCHNKVAQWLLNAAIRHDVASGGEPEPPEATSDAPSTGPMNGAAHAPVASESLTPAQPEMRVEPERSPADVATKPHTPGPLGERLLAAVRAKGISQKALAQASGVHYSVINCIVTGRYRYQPAETTFSRLAVALGTTVEWLRDGLGPNATPVSASGATITPEPIPRTATPHAPSLPSAPDIAERLKVRREAMGISKAVLSRKAGVSRDTIARIENRRTVSAPSDTTLHRIAKGLGGPLSWLRDGEGAAPGLPVMLPVQPSPEAGAIGARVEQARKARGLSQTDLARGAGIHTRTVRAIEAGRYLRPITERLVQRLAITLHVERDTLLAQDPTAAAPPAPTAGNSLRQIREAKGLSQHELARRSGVAQGRISAYELGHVATIPAPAAAAMAKVLGVTPAAFAEGQGAPTPAPADEPRAVETPPVTSQSMVPTALPIAPVGVIGSTRDEIALHFGRLLLDALKAYIQL